LKPSFSRSRACDLLDCNKSACDLVLDDAPMNEQCVGSRTEQARLYW
jgi:hypothetical protein